MVPACGGLLTTVLTVRERVRLRDSDLDATTKEARVVVRECEYNTLLMKLCYSTVLSSVRELSSSYTCESYT